MTAMPKLDGPEVQAFRNMVEKIYPGRRFEELDQRDQDRISEEWRKSSKAAEKVRTEDAYAKARARAADTEARLKVTRTNRESPPNTTTRVSDAANLAGTGSARQLTPVEQRIVDDRLRIYHGPIYDEMTEEQKSKLRMGELRKMGIDPQKLPATVPGKNPAAQAIKNIALGPPGRISDAANLAVANPGMAGIKKGLTKEQRTAVETTFEHDNTDPNGIYVPWVGWDRPRAEDILDPKYTGRSGGNRPSDAAISNDVDSRRETFPGQFAEPPSREEIERLRGTYKADKAKFDEATRKWEEKRQKALKDGKPFDEAANPKPIPENYEGLKNWTPDPTDPGNPDKATYTFSVPEYDAKPTSWVKSINAVSNELKNLIGSNPDKLKEIAAEMQEVGLLDEVYSIGDMEKVWGELNQQAAQWHAARPLDMYTAMDMLDLYHGKKGTTDIGSAGKPGAKVIDVVSRSAVISTNDQARGMLRKMMAQELGRRPTPSEVDEFQAALNKAQRANPEVTTRKTSLRADGTEKSINATTTPGLDEEEFTFDQVVTDDPDTEYGRYQMATTYFNALRAALDGPVPQGS